MRAPSQRMGYFTLNNAVVAVARNFFLGGYGVSHRNITDVERIYPVA